jgi:hypothetical protein
LYNLRTRFVSTFTFIHFPHWQLNLPEYLEMRTWFVPYDTGS